MRNMRNLVKFAFQRVVLVSLGLLIQLVVLLVGIFAASDVYHQLAVGMTVISWLVLLYIISASRAADAYKMAWIIPILALPVLGVFLYLLFGGKRLSQRTRQKMQTVARLTRSELRQDPVTLAALEACAPEAAVRARYLVNAAGHPVYAGGAAQYFSPVDEGFAGILDDLERAEKYIFLEYFIISPGQMWGSVLEILERKAKAGVDVRVLYDDFGCIRHLPMRYARQLRQKGIRCAVFNPYIPILTSRLNNRDHRKLLLVDGRIAYTGGFNLSDEYINRVTRFGHWKDSGLRLEGEAAWSLTVQFLTMWKSLTGDECLFARYRPVPSPLPPQPGFLQPFSDSPLDDERVGENVYLSVIRGARKRLQIMTPYLVIDEELTHALTMAARSGVEVTILTPGIPDKWYIQTLSRAYYPELLEAGVRIFEYTPGFLHSKVFQADDETAVVGTINLDFRSLYLHYEDAVLLTRGEAVRQVAADFARTLPQCTEYTLERSRDVRAITRIFRAILRVFAPLM